MAAPGPATPLGGGGGRPLPPPPQQPAAPPASASQPSAPSKPGFANRHLGKILLISGLAILAFGGIVIGVGLGGAMGDRIKERMTAFFTGADHPDVPKVAMWIPIALGTAASGTGTFVAYKCYRKHQAQRELQKQIYKTADPFPLD